MTSSNAKFNNHFLSLKRARENKLVRNRKLKIPFSKAENGDVVEVEWGGKAKHQAGS